MKKYPFIILLILLSYRLSFANMAQPFVEGTWSSSPFLHEEVDILGEKIWIDFSEKMGPANFKIEYHIHARSTGIEIPFLFYASEYLKGFRIWIDGKEIQIDRVPEDYELLDEKPFAGFDYFFEIKEIDGYKYREIELKDPHMDQVSSLVSIRELKFFQSDITEGNHVIKVEYQAEAGTSMMDWVRVYNYKYALAPARYWRSFGGLEIWIDGRNFPAGNLSSSLGVPDSGSLNQQAYWKFEDLPTDWLSIDFEPEISPLARTLIKIGPEVMAGLWTLALLLLHLYGIKKYRQIAKEKRFSWVYIAGSILIPFLILLGYVISFEIIDWAIGPEASKMNHAYSFIFIFAYPVLLPVYAILLFFWDRHWKRHYQ
ncbi:MAG: hypothetical protein R8P61_30360 [Bacteroidia bacterium]|nr:hypothetical protein [Bacteroidia bacterium]